MNNLAHKLTQAEHEAIAQADRTTAPQADNQQVEVSVTRDGQPRFSMLLDWVEDNYFDAMIEAGTWQIYRSLVRHQDHKTKLSHPGMARLSREARCRPQRVGAKIDWLIRRRLIQFVTPGTGRRADEYFIVQMPRGAKILKPDFSTSHAESCTSHDEQPKQAKTVVADTRKADSEPTPAETPGSTSDTSRVREAQQTGVCCDSSALSQRAERHTTHAMQISRDAGRTWERTAVFSIMAKLCESHTSPAITDAITKTGPQADTPGLIRNVVLKKPTRSETERIEQRRQAKEAKRRQYYAQRPSPEQQARTKRMARQWRDRQSKTGSTSSYRLDSTAKHRHHYRVKRLLRPGFLLK